MRNRSAVNENQKAKHAERMDAPVRKMIDLQLAVPNAEVFATSVQSFHVRECSWIL